MVTEIEDDSHPAHQRNWGVKGNGFQERLSGEVTKNRLTGGVICYLDYIWKKPLANKKRTNMKVGQPIHNCSILLLKSWKLEAFGCCIFTKFLCWRESVPGGFTIFHQGHVDAST